MVSVVVVSSKKNKTSRTTIKIQMNNWEKSIHSGAFYFGGGWGMESITKIIADLEKRVDDLQRDKEGLIQTLECVLTKVEAVNRKVDMLEEALATKADITHVQ